MCKMRVFFDSAVCYRMYWLVLIVALMPGPSSMFSDNIGSFTSTLKNVYRTACDDELVSPACPTGTVIYIQEARYGRPAPEHTCLSDPSEPAAGDECLWPNSMQYSLLKTVVEACQKKPQCQFSTKPSPRVPEPCPHARKFVRVVYKCRPDYFRSRVVCENEVLKLSCNPHSRVAILDAEFGRTAFESECSQKGVPEENCKAPTAAITVMRLCHGKRRCEIQAASSIFGNPCSSATRVYLKVVYACVPLGVLTEQYESAPEADETKDGVTVADRASDLFDTSVYSGDRWQESNVYATMINRALQLPTKPVPTTPLVAVAPTPKDNGKETTKSAQTNTYIYVGISVLLIIIISISIFAVRCYIIKRNARNSKNGDMFTAEAPNVFNDAVSDIDNDIDVAHISGTFYDPAHPDMILYRDVPGNKGTIRAMRPLSTIYPCAGGSMYGNLDYIPPQYREVAAGRLSREASREKEDVEIDQDAVVSPKSLNRFSNSQYYYG